MRLTAYLIINNNNNNNANNKKKEFMIGNDAHERVEKEKRKDKINHSSIDVDIISNNNKVVHYRRHSADS